MLSESLLILTAVAFAVVLFVTAASAIFALRGLRRSPLRSAAPTVLLAAVLHAVFQLAPPALEWRISHARAPLPARYHELQVAIPPDFAAADLHSDALFWWRRDLLARGVAGGVDVPRLVEGAFAIQIFALVVAVPRGLNVHSNSPPTGVLDDHCFPKCLLERWPVSSWTSQLQRALVQCTRLHRVAAASNGLLEVARTSADLVKGRRSGTIQGLLALEGGGALEGKLENLDVLYAAGLRLLGPTHFFDTDIGGSQSGVGRGGLTPFGRDVVARMKQLNMIVDVAHASDAVLEDLASIPDESRPCVVLSHAGVRAVCDSQRNIDDEHLRLL